MHLLMKASQFHQIWLLNAVMKIWLMLLPFFFSSTYFCLFTIRFHIISTHVTFLHYLVPVCKKITSMIISVNFSLNWFQSTLICLQCDAVVITLIWMCFYDNFIIGIICFYFSNHSNWLANKKRVFFTRVSHSDDILWKLII